MKLLGIVCVVAVLLVGCAEAEAGDMGGVSQCGTCAPQSVWVTETVSETQYVPVTVQRQQAVEYRRVQGCANCTTTRVTFRDRRDRRQARRAKRQTRRATRQAARQVTVTTTCCQ